MILWKDINGLYFASVFKSEFYGFTCPDKTNRFMLKTGISKKKKCTAVFLSLKDCTQNCTPDFFGSSQTLSGIARRSPPKFKSPPSSGKILISADKVGVNRLERSTPCTPCKIVAF
jgi:hypothetical protein